jgi:undecaprenyl diphosphate synthase
VALDYSGREAILAAARGSSELSRAGLDQRLGPPVDLLIRTGGERRLSDFLLWESAYAELVFSRAMWPDFGPQDLAATIREFRGRERRYGAVLEAGMRCAAGWLD